MSFFISLSAYNSFVLNVRGWSIEVFFKQVFLSFAPFCPAFSSSLSSSPFHCKKGSERIKSVAQKRGEASLQCRQCPYLPSPELVLVQI